MKTLKIAIVHITRAVFQEYATSSVNSEFAFEQPSSQKGSFIMDSSDRQYPFPLESCFADGGII
jgi:hypothetical protein